MIFPRRTEDCLCDTDLLACHRPRFAVMGFIPSTEGKEFRAEPWRQVTFLNPLR